MVDLSHEVEIPRKTLERRSFLKLLTAVLASLLTACQSGVYPREESGETDNDQPDPAADLNIAASSVQATATTRAETGQQIPVPENLRKSAVFIRVQYSGRASPMEGSGTIIDYDKQQKIGLLLTARHVLFDKDFPVNQAVIQIDRPQNILPPILLSESNMAIVLDARDDIAVVAFTHPDLPIEPLGLSSFDSAWIPNSFDQLFAVSYPGALSQNQTFDSAFKLDKEVWQDGLFASHTIVSPGSSGGLVVREDHNRGLGVGLLTHIDVDGDNKGLTLITPLLRLPALIQQAQDQLAKKLVHK